LHSLDDFSHDKVGSNSGLDWKATGHSSNSSSNNNNTQPCECLGASASGKDNYQSSSRHGPHQANQRCWKDSSCIIQYEWKRQQQYHALNGNDSS
jgi:hypothetical protein